MAARLLPSCLHLPTSYKYVRRPIRKQTDFKMRFGKLTRTARQLANIPLFIFRPFNVCMWHIGRCGSTVVGNLLKQDARIVWGDEILEPYSNRVNKKDLQPSAWEGAKRLIRNRTMTAGSKIFGFEMKIWHLKRIGVETGTALEFLKQQKYDKHILLERKNYLRVIVSGIIGMTTSKWHSKIGEKPISAKVRLDTKEVHELLQFFSAFCDEMKSVLPENHLLLTYEDDILPSPLNAYRKVVNYFELTPREVSVRYQRTNPRDLCEMVLNFEEVRESLKGTEYEWMLHAQ